jgi:hypothetical protein
MTTCSVSYTRHRHRHRHRSTSLKHWDDQCLPDPHCLGPFDPFVEYWPPTNHLTRRFACLFGLLLECLGVPKVRQHCTLVRVAAPRLVARKRGTRGSRSTCCYASCSGHESSIGPCPEYQRLPPGRQPSKRIVRDSAEPRQAFQSKPHSRACKP